MGAQYQSLLFYCISRWLSRENVARVYNLQGEAVLFLEEKNVVHAEQFVSKLVYFSDIFEEFNTQNPSIQENNTNIIIVTDKGKIFIGQLGLCVRKLEGKQCGNK
jgi:hypothetical protein